MKILIIAPLPPPHTGNSLPIKSLFDKLITDGHDVVNINLNKKTHKAGITSLRRIIEILQVLLKVKLIHKRFDLVYLTVAESPAGNTRDLWIYRILQNRISTVIIHMLGGAAMAGILDPRSGNSRFESNKKYLSRIGGIIVEGQKQKNTFTNTTDPTRIYINSNFAEDYLFISDAELETKFDQIKSLNILFLSNLLTGKGHIELVKSFLELPDNIKDRITIDFAGKLVDDKNEVFFLKSIKEQKNLTYHGSVAGDRKRQLFIQSHLFCLPTYYPYEGQPFTIVEAYASGCCVITTDHSGIRYIFEDGVNGYEVEKKSVPALTKLLRKILREKEKIKMYGQKNVELAKSKYTEHKYLERMDDIIASVMNDSQRRDKKSK